MSTITKQAVQAVADLKAGYTLGHADVAILNELARIALASLEAEPVCVIDQSNLDYLKSGSDADVWPTSRTEMGDVFLYRAAPTALVSVPDDSAITQHFDTIALETAREIMCDVNRRHEFLGGEVQLLSRIQCRIDDACRAAMLQGAEFVKEANKLPEGWVMVPKEPTEVMFNAGKLAAGPTKQPDTASLVYKAMIDSSPDYKVGRETAFTGYEVQENVKDYVRRKIHTAFDVEKAVLWILKNSKYPEPDLWVFDIKVQFVDGPVISTDKSVTVVHSTLCKCSPPVGNVQFIECTLPAEWEGKVNAIDCVFKAAPQQEVK
ncbi:hypothetical protein [Enterobacter kobei]|uniref:hypothetical protein n=1 Tax=Enterobacter kobei TaxID=208224 RepID=UPI0034646C36